MDAPNELRLDQALVEVEVWEVAESNLMARRARALHDAVTSARAVDAERGTCEQDFLTLHVAGIGTVAQTTATARIAEARHLVVMLPGTLQALEQGWLRRHQAAVLVEETVGLSVTDCATVEAEVLPWVRDRAAGEVRRRIRRIKKRLENAADAERSRREALAARAVSATALQDGMAGVWATMPAGAQKLFSAALARLAALAASEGDTRTAAQRESDVLAALPAIALEIAGGGYGEQARALLAAHGFRVSGSVRPLETVLLVSEATATGESDEPGELLGYGPVSAEHARLLMTTSTIRVASVDRHGRVVGLSEQVLRPTSDALAATGQALTAETSPDGVDPAGLERVRRFVERVKRAGIGAPGDEPGYRPSARLARFVRLRDPRCIGPGSCTPAWRCDLEHRRPWPHGPTGPGNISPVSRRCHRAKQNGWRYQRYPDGTTTWHARGRTYVRPPHDLL